MNIGCGTSWERAVQAAAKALADEQAVPLNAALYCLLIRRCLCCMLVCEPVCKVLPVLLLF